MERLQVGIDCDGVVCERPTWAVAIESVMPNRSGVSHAMPRSAKETRLSSQIEAIRFAGRKPRKDAAASLEKLATIADLHLITSRTTRVQKDLEGWLHKHGLSSYLRSINCRRPGEPEIQHKSDTARRLGITIFVDDDPRVVRELLASGIAAWFRVGRRVPSSNVLPTVDGLADFCHLVTKMTLP